MSSAKIHKTIDIIEGFLIARGGNFIHGRILTLRKTLNKGKA